MKRSDHSAERAGKRNLTTPRGRCPTAGYAAGELPVADCAEDVVRCDSVAPTTRGLAGRCFLGSISSHHEPHFWPAAANSGMYAGSIPSSRALLRYGRARDTIRHRTEPMCPARPHREVGWNKKIHAPGPGLLRIERRWRSHSRNSCGQPETACPLLFRMPKPCPTPAYTWSSADTPACFRAR